MEMVDKTIGLIFSQEHQLKMTIFQSLLIYFGQLQICKTPEEHMQLYDSMVQLGSSVHHVYLNVERSSR